MKDTVKKINGLKRLGLIEDYAIIGGYAVNFYIEPVLTFDLDILILIEGEENYAALYDYFRRKKYRFENVYVILGGMPVQFLPAYISPLFREALVQAKRVRVEGEWTKIITVEYLIAMLLTSFRPKDRMTIPHLLDLANKAVLDRIVGKYKDEKTPLHQRLRRILASLH